MPVRKALSLFVVFAACFTVFLATGCGSNSSLPALTIVGNSGSLAAGSAMSLKATTSIKGTQADISALATWSSSNTQVASVSEGGVVTGIAPGSAVITASAAGMTTTVPITVTNAKLTGLALNPQGVSMPLGLVQQFAATATYSNGATGDAGSSIAWSVSPANVASIDATGLLSSLAPGSFTVTATSGSENNAVTATATGTVTTAVITLLDVTPASLSLPDGNAQPFHAWVQLSSGTQQDVTSSVQWTSSNTAVATINSAGMMKAHGIGSAWITATLPATTAYPALSSSAAITVTAATLNAIVLTPVDATLATGATAQLTLTGIYTDGTLQDLSGAATWDSSNPSVATVDGNGLVQALSAGTTTITAEAEGKTTSISMTVSAKFLTGLATLPTSIRIAVGTPAHLIAMASYSDGSYEDVSSSVTWSSSNASSATVDEGGLLHGLAIGTVTVTGELGGFQSQTTLIVSPATLTSVALNPSTADVAVGTAQQFSLIGSFSDGSTQDLSPGATWLSSMLGVATVSNTGLVRGIDTGSAGVSATFDGQTATALVQVTPATLVSIALSPANQNLHTGTWKQWHVLGTFSDATTEDMTAQTIWQSSDATVVSISTTGIASALAAGTVQISGTVNGQTASSGDFEITPAMLLAIAITPMTPTMALGSTQQFTAIGTYDDGSTQDLSTMAIWSSSDPQIATIDRNGKAQSGRAGSVQISATASGITATSSTVQIIAGP